MKQTEEGHTESRMREIRTSGSMRGGCMTVIGDLSPLNPSAPAYSTHPQGRLEERLDSLVR